MRLEGSLVRLYSHLSARRRAQLFGLAVLTIAGATAELLTLGAVVPFLGLLADPGRAADYPFIQQLFSRLGWYDSTEIIIPITLLFAFLVISAAIVRLTLTWATSRYVHGVGHDLSVDVYRRTLYQPYQFHVSRNTSEVIAGVGKVQTVITGVLYPLLQAGVAVVIGLAIFVMLFVIDTGIAAAAVGSFSAIYVGITYFTRRRLRRNSKVIAHALSRRVQAVQEGLGGIRDTLLDGTQRIHVNRFRLVDLPYRRAQIANTVVSLSPRYLIEALGVCIIAALAAIISLREGSVIHTLPLLGAFALGAQRLLPLLQMIYSGWAQVAANQQLIIDVVWLLQQPIPPEALAHPTRHAEPFRHTLSLRDVWFRYHPDGPWVIRDVNLTVARGDRIGFTGTTGSGKSTLLDIVMGLLVPTMGDVLVDGRPLTAESLRGWQAQLAHVPQSIYLADTTIAENIAFGVEPGLVDHHKVADAARQAQIGTFIEGLAEGYDTLVGERGVRLSGGQRQRIGLARALYRDARVLILDEATSALDDETETSVMTAIEALGRDISIFIIAHRLTTLSSCDVLVRLEAGKLVGQYHPSESAGIAKKHQDEAEMSAGHETA